MKVNMCNELYVRTYNDTGAGARIFSLLAELGINVIAYNGWEASKEAFFLIVVDGQDETALNALSGAGFMVEQRTVIAVDLTNRPGSLVALLRTLSDANIDIIYSYASGAGAGSDRTKVVLQTSDNEMARHLIQTIPGRA